MVVGRTLIRYALIVVTFLLLVGCEKRIHSQLSILEAKHSYIQGEHERAFMLSESLAYQGNPDAQYALGYMLYYGIGGPENKTLGVAWIEQAARKQNHSAIFALEALRAPDLIVEEEIIFG